MSKCVILNSTEHYEHKKLTCWHTKRPTLYMNECAVLVGKNLDFKGRIRRLNFSIRDLYFFFFSVCKL